MRAILLTGGYGTRLYPLTLRTPKALLPVAGKPVIARIIEDLAKAGFSSAIISMNRNQEAIRAFLGNAYAGVRLDYHVEDSSHDQDKPGAIAAIAEVIAKHGAEDSLIVGADNFIHGLNFSALINAHEKSGAKATIALYTAEDKQTVESTSAVLLDEQGRITVFQEKPRVENAVSNLVSTACYVMSKEFLSTHLPDFLTHKRAKKEKADRLGDIWQHLVGSVHIAGYQFQGTWADVGTASSLLHAHRLAMNDLPTHAHNHAHATIGSHVVIGARVKIGEGAVIKGPAIIEDDSIIGAHAIVGPYTHVMHHSSIGEYARVGGSILFERCAVQAHARVEHSVIDGAATIGEHARVEDYSLVGYGATIEEYGRVLSGTRLWPDVTVGSHSVVEGIVKARHASLHDRYFWI